MDIAAATIAAFPCIIYYSVRVFAAAVSASNTTISGNAQNELASFCMLVEFSCDDSDSSLFITSEYVVMTPI